MTTKEDHWINRAISLATDYSKLSKDELLKELVNTKISLEKSLENCDDSIKKTCGTCKVPQRDLKYILKNMDRIRIKIPKTDHIKIAIYDESRNVLIDDDSGYNYGPKGSPLHQFVTKYYNELKPGINTPNAWSICEVYREDKWIRMNDL